MRTSCCNHRENNYEVAPFLSSFMALRSEQWTGSIDHIVVMETLDISTCDLLYSAPRIKGKVFWGWFRRSEKMCQLWLHPEWNWADNITGMSSMENERNRLQWKTLPSTRVEGRTMCCHVMSFCMQPDTQRAHICESMTAGVKTPKHCGDTTVWISP